MPRLKNKKLVVSKLPVPKVGELWRNEERDLVVVGFVKRGFIVVCLATERLAKKNPKVRLRKTQIRLDFLHDTSKLVGSIASNGTYTVKG